MARIPYDFTPFPRKLHPGWAGRSHASWGLCVRLWLLADGGPIQVHGGDWRASICQQMGIGGRDRPTTRALMADLQSDGLMTVVDGFVHVKFHPEQGRPTTTELRTELVAEESARGSTGVQPGVRQESYPLDLSDRNRSDRFLQTDRQTEETERERARAASDDWKVGYDWFVGAFLGGDSSQAPNVGKWRDDYATIGRKPAAERATVAKVAAVDPWVIANRGGSADPGHFVKYWGRYKAGGPKTVDRGLGSREQAEADQKASAASKLVKLRDEYAARIKQARDDGDTYTAEILAAERDGRLARLRTQAS
jgi:hypothetical protein